MPTLAHCAAHIPNSIAMARLRLIVFGTYMPVAWSLTRSLAGQRAPSRQVSMEEGLAHRISSATADMTEFYDLYHLPRNSMVIDVRYFHSHC